MILVLAVVERSLRTAMGRKHKSKRSFIMKYLFVALFVLPLLSYSQQDSKKQIANTTFTSIGPGYYWASVILHKNKIAIVVTQITGNSLQI